MITGKIFLHIILLCFQNFLLSFSISQFNGKIMGTSWFLIFFYKFFLFPEISRNFNNFFFMKLVKFLSIIRNIKTDFYYISLFVF